MLHHFELMFNQRKKIVVSCGIFASLFSLKWTLPLVSIIILSTIVSVFFKKKSFPFFLDSPTLNPTNLVITVVCLGCAPTKNCNSFSTPCHWINLQGFHLGSRISGIILSNKSIVLWRLLSQKTQSQWEILPSIWENYKILKVSIILFFQCKV